MPAPTLSPEFTGGSVEAGLQALRARLLDLTSRNRLLNFRHSAKSTLRFVDTSIDDAFERLMDGEKLVVQPVPEPPKRPEPGPQEEPQPKPTPSDHARALNWSTSFDLEGERSGKVLRTLHYAEALDTVTRRIGGSARTAIEESGTNMLYVVFGFLEWYESDDSNQPRLAPLVTVPVAIVRSSSKEGGAVIEPSGDDVEPNLSLVERMRRDFGIEIPTLEDEERLPDYLARVSSSVRRKERWTVKRQMTLCLLSFGKLLMYRDLDPAVWPDIKKHAIVTELFEGRKADSVTHATEYDFDNDERSTEAPEVVLDADSSQMSALVDALAGNNLVIEGPPGTGKSQTISNLIAAALANRKTVLFVSEKLAALEVVRRRLDEAGLGTFCLELHSHKTRKHALLQDLEERLDVQGRFGMPEQMDAHLTKLERIKTELRRYATVLSRRHPHIGYSLFDLMWQRERLLQYLGDHASTFESLQLAGLNRRQPLDVGRIESSLNVYERHLHSMWERSPDLTTHAWAWVSIPVSFEAQQRLRSSLAEFAEAVSRLAAARALLAAEYGIEIGETLKDLRGWISRFSSLPSPSSSCDASLLFACRSSEVRTALLLFVDDLDQARRALQGVTQRSDDGGRSVLALGRGGAVSSALDEVGRWGFEQLRLAEVDDQLRLAAESIDSLRDVVISFESVAGRLGWTVGASQQAVDALLACLDLLARAPVDALHLRSTAFESEGASSLVRDGVARSAELTAQWNALGERYDLGLATSVGASVLRQHAQTILASTLWQRWFGKPYREAITLSRLLTKQSKPPSRDETARDVLAVADAIDARQAFTTSQRLRSGLGDAFDGFETEWSALQRLADWYEQVADRQPADAELEGLVKRTLLRSSVEDLRRIVRQLEAIGPGRARLERLPDVLAELSTRTGLSALRPDSSLGDIADVAMAKRAELDRAANVVRNLRLAAELTFAEVPEILQSAKVFATASQRLLDNRTASELFGEVGIEDVNRDGTLAAVHFAGEIEAGEWPELLQAKLLGPAMQDALRRIEELAANVRDFLPVLRDLSANIEDLSGSSDWSLSSSRLNVLSERARVAVAMAEDLQSWSDWVGVKSEVEQQGLGPVVTCFESGQLPTDLLLSAFRLALCSSLIRGLLADSPHASTLSGLTQEELRRQFRAADREAIKFARLRAAARMSQRDVPQGNHTGPVKTWSELALIRNELAKQKRHIPIRQLVRRAGHALQALKPCFLMGPLSVAQYLPPGQLKFDLVVMDEASQLKPEDAVGAIARGGQIVVVGDPKQLPPTNFFQRVVQDEEADDETTVAEEGESILDVACTLYQPVRRLRWHYRSRHESLIAFSNREFYQGKLIVFPSAHAGLDDLGIRYHAVRGVYENRRNHLEAQAVAAAVIEHMRSRPGESLGVVTLNFEQREILDEVIDRLKKDDPEALAFEERMEAGAEPFFVKNLENVQGDERDVIFISCTYGPDANGNQYQRFGPINGANGHRRLNVLFTRAKRRVEVFSSLNVEKIQEEGTAWGVRVLKQYLTYAKTGRLEGDAVQQDVEENDFEQSVGSVLRQAGFDVVPQVGVSGFRIDLGIRNPAKPGTFVLGVECDGSAYHSGRSARDRDRLRQEILENLGWKIHRVWSTDWYHSRQRESAKLVQRVHDELKADPEYRTWLDRRTRFESLRTHLDELRAAISVEHPETSADQSLLRDEVLELLVTKRPTTHADWFRVVPLALRERTDPAQVRKYLARVFDLIRDASE